MTRLWVPYIQQATSDTCAPACLLMAAMYHDPRTALTEATIARTAHRRPGLGCAIRDVHQAAAAFDLRPTWLRGVAIRSEVRAAVLKKSPVVAFVRLRALSHLAPSPEALDDFHAVIVVGVDGSRVVCHDPAPSGGPLIEVPGSDFFGDWIAQRHAAFSCAPPRAASFARALRLIRLRWMF
jgi:ABC-type bacteriocin/lantibiotic exporter with double-glycine peptidase domain